MNSYENGDICNKRRWDVGSASRRLSCPVASRGPRYRLRCWYMACIGSSIHAPFSSVCMCARVEVRTKRRELYLTFSPLRQSIVPLCSTILAPLSSCVRLPMSLLHAHPAHRLRGFGPLFRTALLPAYAKSADRGKGPPDRCRRPNAILSYYKTAPILPALSHTCRHDYRISLYSGWHFEMKAADTTRRIECAGLFECWEEEEEESGLGWRRLGHRIFEGFFVFLYQLHSSTRREMNRKNY